MLRRVLFLLPLILSCSLFEQDVDVEFEKNMLVGEWLYVDFGDEFHLVRAEFIDKSSLEMYISYTIRSNGECEIQYPHRPFITYENCSWTLVEDAPNPKLQLAYLRKAYQTTFINDFSLIQSFYNQYLYDVSELSERSLFLKHNLSVKGVRTDRSGLHIP